MSSQSSTPKKNERSLLLVDRDVQSGILRKVSMHWVAWLLCNVFGLILWVKLFERPELAWSATIDECVHRFLPVLVISLLLVPAFVLDTFKMTHRFAGPISRLRTELRNAAQGRPVETLHFRTNDYWREIAHGFNELARMAGVTKEKKST